MSTGTLLKELESKAKVRFHDCDPFNHLNNSRYIDYIMAARGDQLIEHYHLDIYKLAREEGLGWVTAQTQISYMAPAHVMESVTIQTRLLSFSNRSLMVEAIMWNDDKTALKALMWTKLVHYHLPSQQVHVHSETFMQLFEQIVHIHCFSQQSEFNNHKRYLFSSDRINGKYSIMRLSSFYLMVPLTVLLVCCNNLQNNSLRKCRYRRWRYILKIYLYRSVFFISLMLVWQRKHQNLSGQSNSSLSRRPLSSTKRGMQEHRLSI